MSATLLSCPNCGAPLSHLSAGRAKGDLWPCIHCGALLRVAANAAPVLEREVAPELTARLRQLVLEGKKDEAQRLATEAGLPPDFIARLSTELFIGILYAQKLNGVGILMFLLGPLVASAGLFAVQLGYWVGWIAAVLGILYALPLVRPLFTTLRMAFLPAGVATIRRATYLGTREPSRVGERVSIYAFDVAIAPTPGVPSVEGTVLVPVREQSRAKAVPGTQIVVRFNPRDPSFIRFDRMA